MKLYQAVPTVDLHLTEKPFLDEYMRVIKRSSLLPHYKLDFYRKKEHRAKNCKRANKHSYKQYCKSAAFLAYDRTAQQEMIDALPAVPVSERTLRLEVQLQRKGMKKWVGKNGMDGSNWSILKKLGECSEEIFLWYMKRLQPVGRIHLPYSDAVNMIGSMVTGKNRERTLYLLRKARENKSITTALKKLRKKYKLDKKSAGLF